MTTIRLTGRVVGWDEEGDFDERTIAASETETYEANGYLVCEIAGKPYAMKSIPFEDGTIQLQPESDMLGRFASSEVHANYGYSGYFKAYVYLEGKRKALVDFWSFLPWRWTSLERTAGQGRGGELGLDRDSKPALGPMSSRLRGVMLFDWPHTPSGKLPRTMMITVVWCCSTQPGNKGNTRMTFVCMAILGQLLRECCAVVDRGVWMGLIVAIFEH